MDFLQFLIKKGALDKKKAPEIKEIAKKEGKLIEEVILVKKALEEKALFNFKSEFLDVQLIEANPDKITPDVINFVPKESVEFYHMIPLASDKQTGTLDVGMVYPEDNKAQEALKFLARQQKLSPRVFLITLSDFKKCLARYQAPEREVEKAIKSLEGEMRGGEEEGDFNLDKGKFDRLVEEAPVIKMVAVILRQAVEGGASDIHIEPTREASQVRYRMDGILYSTLSLPLKAHPAIVARIKILSSLKIDETRIPQDGRFSTKFGDKRIDYRVSTFPTTLGEKVVLRVLDPSEGLKTLADLGLDGDNLEKTEAAIEKPYGMILVTGPTGSGKSTTLYAVLKILNKESVNIVTLEDPVEYFMDGVNQSQVKAEIGYTFARGLRQILRQDPDIIMVGEIRDEETANLAVHAALTGHLVLSTLHTNNAVGAVPRLVDMGIKQFLIPATLILGISQRLARRLCQECAEKVKATGKVKEYILEKTSGLPEKYKEKIKEPLYVYKPNGCKKCNMKGFAGRVGIFEVMPMTDRMAALITDTQAEGELFKQARADGMITMLEDGVLKALAGLTTLEEVVRIAED